MEGRGVAPKETDEKKGQEEMKRIAVVYASRYGHTKLLAEHVASGAGGVPGTEVAVYTAGEAELALDELDAADAIVFGTATYMGSAASEMKHFMESAAGRWFDRSWCDKIAGGFTNSSNFSGDKLMTMQELVVFAMQMGMIWCGVTDLAGANEPESSKNVEGPTSRALNRNSGSLGVMASSFQVKAPGAPPIGDLETASRYGRRIAEITHRFAVK